MLPLWVRVDLGVMAIKRYSALPKSPAPSDCLVSYPGHLLLGGLPLYRSVFGVFCSSPLTRQEWDFVFHTKHSQFILLFYQ